MKNFTLINFLISQGMEATKVQRRVGFKQNPYLSENHTYQKIKKKKQMKNSSTISINYQRIHFIEKYFIFYATEDITNQ